MFLEIVSEWADYDINLHAWKPGEHKPSRLLEPSLIIHRSPSAEAVFATAAKRFYDELPDEDKQIFRRLDDPEDMIASIQQHVAQLNSQWTSRLLDACRKIEQFSKAIGHFFKIIDIFVSSHPD